MSELKEILSEKQCDLLYRELQNFAPQVCSPRSTTELIIYNFLLTKTVYFRKISERITPEYFRRGHSGHCIRAFPRTRWPFRRALKSLEKRGVITVTRTDHPNWFEARLELPGLLARILAAPVGYENSRNRELLVFAADRLKRCWESRGWKWRAIKLRPEIAKLQSDIFDEPPKEQVAGDIRLDRIRRSMHKLCVKHGVEFAWHVVGSAMAKTILRGYDRYQADCKKYNRDATQELEEMVAAWPSFVASKPKNEEGLRFSISPKLRMVDFFIYRDALRRHIRERTLGDEYQIDPDCEGEIVH